MYLTFRPLQTTETSAVDRFGASRKSLTNQITGEAKRLYTAFGPKRTQVEKTIGQGLEQTQVTISILPKAPFFSITLQGNPSFDGHYNFGIDGQFRDAIINRKPVTELTTPQKQAIIRILRQVQATD